MDQRSNVVQFPAMYSRHSFMSCREVEGNVEKFPSHCRVRCDPGCDGCFYCEGGLFACSTCGGAESSLTTHCSGEKLPLQLHDLVSASRLDFLRSMGWVYRYSADDVWIQITDGVGP